MRRHRRQATTAVDPREIVDGVVELTDDFGALDFFDDPLKGELPPASPSLEHRAPAPADHGERSPDEAIAPAEPLPDAGDSDDWLPVDVSEAIGAHEQPPRAGMPRVELEIVEPEAVKVEAAELEEPAPPFVFEQPAVAASAEAAADGLSAWLSGARRVVAVAVVGVVAAAAVLRVDRPPALPAVAPALQDVLGAATAAGLSSAQSEARAEAHRLAATKADRAARRGARRGASRAESNASRASSAPAAAVAPARAMSVPAPVPAQRQPARPQKSAAETEFGL